MAVSNAAGKFIDTVIEGSVGIGTIHGWLLAATRWLESSRGVQLIIPGLGLAAAGDKFNWNSGKKIAIPAMLVCGTITYGAFATGFASRQLTSAMTKQILSRAVLTTIDAYAVYKLFKDWDASTTGQTLAGLYLGARVIDALVNFGAVSEGLVRFNAQPLLANINTIRGWVR